MARFPPIAQPRAPVLDCGLGNVNLRTMSVVQKYFSECETIEEEVWVSDMPAAPGEAVLVSVLGAGGAVAPGCGPRAHTVLSLQGGTEDLC